MTPESTPPAWQRPAGVAAGTWDYVHHGAIARHYDGFVADTPLCQLDLDYVLRHLNPLIENSFAGTGLPTRPILDLGCGTGRISVPLSHQGLDVLAIDLSLPMLGQLCQRTADSDAKAPPQTTAETKLGRLHPVQANLVQLDGIADQVASAAICMFSTLGMIQGAQNRLQFLKHVRRIVQPEGLMIAHVHRHLAALRETGGLGKLIRGAWQAWRQPETEWGDAVYGYRGLEKMFMHRFSKRELIRLLATAGWEVQVIDRVNLHGDGLTRSRWNTGGYFIVAQATGPVKGAV
ncbi:MAG: hypothetical protein CBB71_05355 [Rhodopirellula sp. TMED11]|nr:MAG: hypothetical protein CBB71_05355 [Rhodopirellula sp. TMED11]